MNTTTTATATENLVLSNFTAVNFLISDGNRTILLDNISWTEYEMFLAAFAARPHRRIACDEGKLEIVPPLTEHETPALSVDTLVRL